ncbi:hypothetical protein AB1K42_14240 [Roseibium algicola]|uniref:hypothetical protein n=1 Tax=Roseibium algicola TaxID=2857014 RepID=UPI00345A460E
MEEEQVTTTPEIQKLEATISSKLTERDKLLTADKPDFTKAAELDHDVDKLRHEIALRQTAEHERREKEAANARAREIADRMKAVDALLKKRLSLAADLNKAIDHFAELYAELGRLNAEIDRASLAPPYASPETSPFSKQRSIGPIRERLRRMGADWACDPPLIFKALPPDLVEVFDEQNKLFRARQEEHVSQTETQHVAR